jgi:hypothetical protein
VISKIANDEWTEDTAIRVGGVPLVEAVPKCGEHNLDLQLVRVEISKDKIVTDVYGCPFPGCKTELFTQQPQRTVESEK